MAAKEFHLTRPEPLEHDIQRAILALLKRHPKVAWSGRINSGAFAVGEGRAKRFIRCHDIKGMSDIIGQLKDGRFLAIEVKRPSTRPTEDQTAFLLKVNNNLGVAFVARSIADVLDVLGGI